ncbi:Rad52/Rad22 family DNA repair protein [Lachnospiraceae bacterium 45-W7]
MEQNKIRLLRSDEIECRVGTISEKGLSLLLYKDARADMKILDEAFGVTGWKRHHEMIGGNLYCTVSIWDGEKKQWIDKMDVGTESYTEKEKGQASDSFKRACVSIGVGRELYTAPWIWIGASKARIQKKGDGKNVKYYTYDKFTVRSISYNENREITGLTIINQDGNVVYSLAEKGSGAQQDTQAAVGNSSNSGMESPKGRSAKSSGTAKNSKTGGNNYAEEINKELARTGVALDAVLARYGVSGIEEMSDGECRNAINSLKKTKTAA